MFKIALHSSVFKVPSSLKNEQTPNSDKKLGPDPNVNKSIFTD